MLGFYLLGLATDVQAVNLYLRPGSATCLYNGSTSQTLQTVSGTNQAGMAFSAVSNTFCFYSPSLTNSVDIAAGKKAGGAVGVQNNGSADFQFQVSEILYDYDPATGNRVQIVATPASTWVSVGPNGSTAQATLPETRVGGAGYTMLSGHLLETAITVTVNSDSGINGSLIYNVDSGSGESFVEFPHGNDIVWPFGNFTTPTAVSAPELICANINVNGANQFVVSWPTVTSQTYQLECATNLAAPAWTPLGGPLTGTGDVMAVTNSMGAMPQCFFRLLVQPVAQ